MTKPSWVFGVSGISIDFFPFCAFYFKNWKCVLYIQCLNGKVFLVVSFFFLNWLQNWLVNKIQFVKLHFVVWFYIRINIGYYGNEFLIWRENEMELTSITDSLYSLFKFYPFKYTMICFMYNICILTIERN